jgi:endonuclease/exonuclease/phosphatase family metal-dependent hydrolase
MTRASLLLASLSLALGCGASEPADATTAATDPADDGSSADGTDGATACGDACPADGTAGVPGDCELDGTCGDRTLRIATWNVLRIDPVGSEAFDALVAIVTRLDADILCMQEVGEGEESQLQALADAGGYPFGLLTPASGPPGTGIANACMSRIATADAAYLWSDWISPDASARDITRPYVRLRILHPGSNRYLSVLSGHLKAGSDEVSRFRRMVDAIRLGQAAAAEHDAYPGNAVVVLGDFNERPDPDASTFAALPAGLPDFYTLGSDIALPLQYAPGQPLLDAGLTRAEARWRDGTETETFIPSPSRLDYVYVGDADILASEVYEACRDDDADAIDGISKTGAALPCGTSESASDHRPVVVELRL